MVGEEEHEYVVFWVLLGTRGGGGGDGEGEMGGLLMFFKDSEGEGSIGVAAKPGNDRY